jgi:hypothetical protein
MAFDDGTPLDAAKLQSLETELNNVKASIPKIGSSTVNIDASSTTNQTIVQSQIVGGITSGALEVPANSERTQPITFSGLTSAPIAVSITPYKSSGTLKGVNWALWGVPTQTGCEVKVWNSTTTKQTLRFSWIAICGNK